MLLNLKTVYKPTTLDDAITLLAEPGTFPLYGGAALHRHPRADVRAVVDLSRLGLDYVQDSENNLRLGAMLTLEQARKACAARAEESPRVGAIAQALAAEFPETLRNTLTLGDLLMERPAQSPTLTLFLVLGAVIKRLDTEMHFTAAAWLAAREDLQRLLIAHVRLLRGPKQAAVAFEKVSRTPADLPIVGAVACIERGEDGRQRSSLALSGVAPLPIPQPAVARLWDDTGDLERALAALELDPPSDHWGSAEYRAAMARLVAGRALQRASRALESPQ